MDQRWKEGDLVFVRITGYPWWPGQVMAEDRVSSKFMALKKAGTFPVNFFGDNEFGWSPSEDMISLPDHFVIMSKPKGAKHKNFVRAAEEAKEVWDRRRNIEPSTSHHPVDFLDPETYPMTDEEETPQRNRDLRPPPLDAQAAKGITALSALQLLYETAQQEGETPDEVSDEAASVLRQLLFSNIRRRVVVVRAQGPSPSKAGTMKLKRGPESSEPAQKKKHKGEKAGTMPKQKRPEQHVKMGRDRVEDSDGEQEASARQPAPPKRHVKEDIQISDSDLDDSSPTRNGSEELRLRPQGLRKFLDKVRACAADEGAHQLLLRKATEFAAFLRFREKAFQGSHFNKVSPGAFGPALKDAMSTSGCRLKEAAAQAKGRRKSGIPAPVPEPADNEAPFVEYADRVPQDKARFMQQLETFYAESNALLHNPQVDGKKVDLQKVFQAVAERGGCAAVMLNRQWRQVASAWSPESASKPQVPMQIRKLYFLLLLAYEIQLRAGAPSHSITKETKKAKAAKPANVAKADGSLPAPQASIPASAPAPEDESDAELEDADEEEEVDEDEEEDSEDERAEQLEREQRRRQQEIRLRQEKKREAARRARVEQAMASKAPEKKRRQPNGHEAFADLDDEPLQRTKRPERKAEQDFDMVGAVLNNLRRPDSGPPRKQLKIKFNDAYELPSQAVVWTIVKTILEDELALKKEAVLLNHLSKSVVVTFKTEQEARKVYGFMDKKKIVFKAPRTAVELSLIAAGDARSKQPPKRSPAHLRNGGPKPALTSYSSTASSAAPYQDPRRAPAAPAPQRASLFQSLAARPAQPANVTPVGDTRLLYGRPSQTGAVVQQPPQQQQQQQQQQQHQYAAYGQAMPPAAPVQAASYVQPADPRRAVLADPRLASMQGMPPQQGNAQGSAAGGVPQLAGMDLMAILQSVGIQPMQQGPPSDVKQEQQAGMQAPMLAGEMEHMDSTPAPSGQWASQGSMPSMQQVKAKVKAEQEGPNQSGLQDSGLEQMSHQMLQILERLNKDA
ncbi:hypothetical protein CVIRNUC_009550 [Coccomyxa viridis]|uniref:PWWP domain-containing protein n=1 Tax=Coccomyxa viridis TaxID=1274662 RepID=A0AAV1II48_9CHLO|nr:hypothetical protein CVIRNUC_009550 [Coccomyxa viridis]